MKKSKAFNKQIARTEDWQLVNPHAAGVDIGAREHWVCVPGAGGTVTVRQFGTGTAELEAIAARCQASGVTSVAMEATGIYWIPRFQILEAKGLAVLLVNARHTKNVAGRKSNVQDCQWIKRRHPHGLLRGSFRPADPIVGCVLICGSATSWSVPTASKSSTCKRRCWR